MPYMLHFFLPLHPSAFQVYTQKPLTPTPKLLLPLHPRADQVYTYKNPYPYT